MRPVRRTRARAGGPGGLRPELTTESILTRMLKIPAIRVRVISIGYRGDQGTRGGAGRAWRGRAHMWHGRTRLGTGPLGEGWPSPDPPASRSRAQSLARGSRSHRRIFHTLPDNTFRIQAPSYLRPPESPTAGTRASAARTGWRAQSTRYHSYGRTCYLSASIRRKEITCRIPTYRHPGRFNIYLGGRVVL